jgi:uncharacterized membrane protein
MADNVATLGGILKFIIIYMLFFFGWITCNTMVLRNKSFYPFPYILLNIFLFGIAAIQAPVIMMSQNRKVEKDW